MSESKQELSPRPWAIPADASMPGVEATAEALDMLAFMLWMKTLAPAVQANIHTGIENGTSLTQQAFFSGRASTAARHGAELNRLYRELATKGREINVLNQDIADLKFDLTNYMKTASSEAEYADELKVILDLKIAELAKWRAGRFPSLWDEIRLCWAAFCNGLTLGIPELARRVMSDTRKCSEPPTIECKEFYELMQIYRHMPITAMSETVQAYEDVIAFVDRAILAASNHRKATHD